MQSTTSAIIRGLSVIIFLFFLSTPLDAQIKIKSHVEIKPDSIQSHQSSINQLKKTSGEKDFVIVPRSGTLIINGTLETMVNPMQGNETMTIFLGGKSYTYNISSPFFELEAQDPFTCRNSDDTTCQLYDYWYYSPNIIFPVHANDTLRLSYSGYSIPYYGYPDEFNDDGYGLFFVPNPVTVGWCSCIWDRIYYIPKLFWIGASYRTEIMLGESKYLQAYWDDYNQCVQWASGLTDTRNHVDVGVVPPGITFTVESVGGSKCGVYWEQINAEGNPDVNGDMIRLIGRYWEKDSTFAVNVTANCNGKTNTFGSTIYTMAPDRLLTPGQKPTYEKTLDVFNNERNIDSICIYYGGKYGIPPHFLKGQMLEEAATWDFGYTGFSPTYVFEPFTAQFLNWEQDRYKKGPWYVDPKRTGHEMGTGKDVPLHQNVHDLQYPRSPKTLWDIIYDYSELVNTGTGKDHKQYGSRKSDGTMKFSKKYDEIYKKYAELLHKAKLRSFFSTESVGDLSREYMIEFLRDVWNDGAKDIIAQTRLASSYGLLQMLYPTAVEQIDYPANNPQISPEDFNVTDICMHYSMEYMKKKLKRKLTPSVEQNGNWPNGFEYYFKKYIWPTWNTGTGYSQEVYLKTQLFLPQNQ